VTVGACLVSVLLAGACAGEDPTRPADSSASGATRSFSVDEAHLSFDLPSDWEEFDRDRMQEALSDSTTMDDLTDRMGMSDEQFQQMLASNVVLFVTAPHAVAGFLDNVNVVVADGRLPRLGSFELQFRHLGATDIRSAEVSTDVGDGYSTTYTLALNGIEVHGQAIAFAVEDRVVMITVSSHDAGEADSVADEIRHSLAPAG